jgi:hypothetical protein
MIHYNNINTARNLDDRDMVLSSLDSAVFYYGKMQRDMDVYNSYVVAASALIDLEEYGLAEELLLEGIENSAEYRKAIRAGLLYNLGSLQRVIGDYGDSEMNLMRSLRFYESMDKPVKDELLQVCIELGFLYLDHGKAAQAKEYLVRAKSLCDEMNLDHGTSLAAVYAGLFLVEKDLGDDRAANRYGERAGSLIRSAFDPAQVSGIEDIKTEWELKYITREKYRAVHGPKINPMLAAVIFASLVVIFLGVYLYKRGRFSMGN